MALMHQTTMSPSKLELIADWLPKQPWFAGDVTALQNLGGYRFDDPAGEVGLEGILVTAGDETVYHVPLTYRSAPLEGAESFLVGTSEHGVLGTRWISDAAGDPVYRAVMAHVMATGGRGSEEFVAEADGTRVPRVPRVPVRGTGAADNDVPDLSEATVETMGSRTRIEDDLAALELVRVVKPSLRAREDQFALEGTWEGQPEAAILALLNGG